MDGKINKFFNLKNSILIIITICLFTIITSNIVYNYEHILSTQDASNYILLAKDLRNYLNVPHQDALRVFPSLLAFFLTNLGFNIENSFKILTYLSFIILNIKLFLFITSYNIKNYLAISSIGIIIYANHSIIYSVFNYYQLVDLLSYILIIFFIDLLKNEKHKLLFIVSLTSIFTKEYLLVLVLTVYCKYFFDNRTLKSIIPLLVILAIFIIHYKYAALNYYDGKNIKTDVISLIRSYYNDINLYFNSATNGLLAEKNIFLFFPFVIFIFSINFLNFLKNYTSILIFAAVPLAFSILLYHNVGNNFFRVFYHGYFIIVLLSTIFLSKYILNDNLTKFLFFISPCSFLLDIFYIFINIRQDGFFNYFQIERYNYLSGFYIFNLIIIIISMIKFKMIFKKNEKETFNS